MKNVWLIITLSIISQIQIFADTYEILELNPSPIIIGGDTLTVGSQFSSASSIEWTDAKQFMRTKNKTKENEKPKKFYSESFWKHKVTNIDYYLKVGQMGTREPSYREIDYEQGFNKSLFEDKRIALVIGNSEYEYVDYLTNSLGDAILIKDKLKELGFDVITCYDGSLSDMRNTLNYFKNLTKQSHYDVAFFYYAGHGVQSNDNADLFLLPTDIQNDEFVIKRNCFSALDVRDAMIETGCLSMMFFDACRVDKDVRGYSSKNYSMDPGGAFIAFSTSNGKVSYDKYYGGTNGPFATSIVNFIGRSGESLTTSMDKITLDVYNKTNSSQKPTYNNGLLGPYYLVPASSETIAKITDNMPNNTKESQINSLDSSKVIINSTDTLTSAKYFNSINGHEYVDLGLPSGTLWATCNLGASNPEDNGDYFVWGSTKPGRPERNKPFSYNEIPPLVLHYDYDAAYEIWGPEWCIPTESQLKELKEKCKWDSTTMNGRNGYLITGKNGNSIFLPFAGFYDSYYINLNGKGTDGRYFSKSRYENINYAYCLNFSQGVILNEPCAITYGLSIRPVLSGIKLNNEFNKTFTVNGVSFTMVHVQGGTFTMGATSEMENPTDYEKPTHQETLDSYYIGQTEVTKELWKAVMGEKNNLSKFKGVNLPAEDVSWIECCIFLRKLNQLTGMNFRLPTEAEWEFAARGGNNSNHTQYSGSNDIDEVAWYGPNSGNKTHPVATKKPNELGIYDMCGNVSELCNDDWKSWDNRLQKYYTDENYRARRGGDWNVNSRFCRSSFRWFIDTDTRRNSIGLRLCLSY